mmetsp:Transcript_33475/g.65779  ORF Transcript_33475/g.65779 Transcript_33475/m.65779 type:complete len:515 (-) Transcript_33475:119-1663(-)
MKQPLLSSNDERGSGRDRVASAVEVKYHTRIQNKLKFTIFCFSVFAIMASVIYIGIYFLHPVHHHPSKSSFVDVPLQGGVVNAYGWLLPVKINDEIFQLLFDTSSGETLLAGAECGTGCGIAKRWSAGPNATPVSCNSTSVHCTRCNMLCVDLLSTGAAGDHCGFYDTYADSSSVCGQLWFAAVSLGGLSSSSQVVVGDVQLGHKPKCFKRANDTMSAGDGIIGFAESSSVGAKPAFSQLVADGIWAERTFSTCLTPQQGGVLTLGGVNSSLFEGQLQFVPSNCSLQSSGFTVLWLDFLVAGSSVNVPASPGCTTIDTSTALTFLQQDVFKVFQAQVQQRLCSSSNVSGVCYPNEEGKTIFDFRTAVVLDAIVLDLFPVVTVVLQGVDGQHVNLDLNPAQYLQAITPADSNRFILMITNSSRGMLAGSFLSSQYVSFDLENSQLGFASPHTALCENAGSLEQPTTGGDGIIFTRAGLEPQISKSHKYVEHDIFVELLCEQLRTRHPDLYSAKCG